MPESLARFYFVQLLSAVQYMHKNGFIHGDIKLENILLDEEFNIKIADFGFSEQKGNREQRTSVMGKQTFSLFFCAAVVKSNVYILAIYSVFWLEWGRGGGEIANSLITLIQIF